MDHFTKKLISILVLLVAALAFGLHQYFSQPKNIFDEIYQETKKTYQSNNVLGKIKDFDIYRDIISKKNWQFLPNLNQT